MKSISIIIPVYNVEQYLAACLDSILVDNTFSGEVICVNDGSTDSSGVILTEYARKYTNLKVINQKNGGSSKARNTGLSSATGDYVLFVDSDDMLTPGALDIFSANISDEDILLFDARVFDETTNSFEKQETRQPVRNIRGQDYYMTYPTNEPPFWCICVWGGGYRRDFLLKNNLWNQEGLTYEDELFTPKALFLAEKISTIPEPLYIYRRRANSITANVTFQNCRDHIYIANDLYCFFKGHNWLTNASKQSIWDNYYYALKKSLLCKLPRAAFWHRKDGQQMLECSFTRRHRRTSVLAKFSFPLAVAYYSYQLPRMIRKLVNILIR